MTLGGASVGDHDLVRDVLTTSGVALDFWKIAIRPGKPLMVGRRGATRFIGMPGNPVASLVCSHLFLKPLVAKLSGTIAKHDIRQAVLGAPMPANDLREDYVRAKLAIEDGSCRRHALPCSGFVHAACPGRFRRADHPPALRTGRGHRRSVPGSHALTFWN